MKCVYFPIDFLNYLLQLRPFLPIHLQIPGYLWAPGWELPFYHNQDLFQPGVSLNYEVLTSYVQAFGERAIDVN